MAQQYVKINGQLHLFKIECNEIVAFWNVNSLVPHQKAASSVLVESRGFTPHTEEQEQEFLEYCEFIEMEERANM